ncbi:hypothetical protein HJB52_14235 [Rhizobium lentis]|uniref:hypothetical protein n=1 Tax=Rhizobium lentis TaxID=1138194 RepID=UPI001C82E7BF|nr:hypothetical protein [Rhizobium lentis]MBX5103031.1 hypothetical protein [Rhizobium lentis]
MDEKAKFLSRVQTSADTLSAQLQQKSNVPIDAYVDMVGLQAVTDALSIDPSKVTRNDLARIHIIRDSLHEALLNANDGQDAGGHSIEQLLNSLSRLYVDVERLLQEDDKEVQEARALVQSLLTSPRHLVNQQLTQQVAEQATAIIGSVQITQRVINLKILNFDFKEVNLFKEFRMNIKRLSASVFAIKLGFDKGIVFEGTIRFLNEGVDRIISDIAKFSEFAAEKYQSVKDFLDALDPLVEKGTRFVRFIGNVIKDLFETDQYASKEVDFVVQTRQKTPILLCAAPSGNGDVLFAGRRGTNLLFNKRTSQFIKLPTTTQDDIQAIGALPENQGFILGTPEGLLWVQNLEKNRVTTRARFTERVTAVAVAPWSRAAIISGSKNGYVRRWSLSGGLSAYIDNTTGQAVVQKLGKTVQAIAVWNEQIVVSGDESVWILDEHLEIQTEVPIGKAIAGMVLLPNDSVAVVGTGLLGEVNLARGAYNRMLTVTPTTEYVAVAHLYDRIVVAGTSSGIVRAIDMNNGAEIGEINTEIGLRGLVVQNNIVFAYGGSWSRELTSLSKLLWQESEISGPPA